MNKEFEKVTIQSKNVCCVLDDTVTYDYGPCFSEKDLSDIDLKKRNDITTNKNEKYPVPKFTTLESPSENTTIQLDFRKNDPGDLLNELKNETLYYFLDNIATVKLNGSEIFSHKIISDKASGTFWAYEASIENITEDILKKNPRWETISVADFQKLKKARVQVLFPKEVPQNSSSPTFYCGLPVSNLQMDFPFYLNCTAVELSDDRKSLNTNVNDWNKFVLEQVLCAPNCCLYRIFKKFAKDHPEIAYQYFPYIYLQKWEWLNSVPFIYTTMGEKDENEKLKFELMSYKECYTKWTWNPNHTGNTDLQEIQKGFIFLPEYMYEWFTAKNELHPLC